MKIRPEEPSFSMQTNWHTRQS